MNYAWSMVRAGQGWPLAWYINVNARLLDGEKTDLEIRKMLTASAARNFFNASHVFQIDGNLGAAAGIAECLLQSHIALHFLPALPVSWKEGRVTGLCARGPQEIDMEWRASKLVKAVVRPRFDGVIEVVGQVLKVSCDDRSVSVKETEIGFEFYAEGGKSYQLVHSKEEGSFQQRISQRYS